jgi:hypothetical protein
MRNGDPEGEAEFDSGGTYRRTRVERNNSMELSLWAGAAVRPACPDGFCDGSRGSIVGLRYEGSFRRIEAAYRTGTPSL